MNTVIYFGFPAEGHLNPSIELFNQLSKKGVKIYYYTTQDQFYKFEHIKNIEMKEYPDIFSEYGKRADALSKNISLALYMLYDMTNQLVEFAVNEIKRIEPSLVINDVFALWGKMAARFTNTPMAIFSCMFLTCKNAKLESSPKEGLAILAKLPTLIAALQLRKKAENKINVSCDRIGDLFSDQNEYTIVMSTKRFHPNGALFGKNVLFLGNGVATIGCTTKKRDRIFVSLGTLCENKTFWNRCILASKDLGYKVVLVAYGKNEMYIKPSLISENVEIYKKMALKEYEKNLANAVLFINHGGLNGIGKAIIYQTPVLVCPDTSERAANGKMAEVNHCGLCMKDQNVSVKALSKAIKKILNDVAVINGLKVLSEDFKNSPGYEKVAVDVVRTFKLDI